MQLGHTLGHMPRADTGGAKADFATELLRNGTWFVNVKLKDSQNRVAAFDWGDTVLTEDDIANPRLRAAPTLWNQSRRMDREIVVESIMLFPMPTTS